MIQAAFFDFDNTLFSHSMGRIPDSARKAVRVLQGMGIRCVLATGRHTLELKRFPEVFELELDGYVTIDGQMCLDENLDIICASRIEGENLDHLLRLFNGNEYTTILVEKDRMYVNRHSTQRIEGLSYASSVDHPIGEYTGNDIFLGVVYVRPEEEAEIQALLPGCNLMRWSMHGVDVSPKGRDKVSGIMSYLDHYGIPHGNYIAFGDGENDRAMVEKAPIGVAMGNAVQSVKDAAKHITTDIDDDGIWNALTALGIIREGACDSEVRHA